MMSQILIDIWNFQLSLTPVLSAILIFEASSVLRRYMRWAYMPIYFMFFPLGHADKLYAEYVDEDDFYMIGSQMTLDDKKLLRLKIVSISFWSMIFSVILNPLLAGMYCAIFLTSEQFTQFIVVLLSGKLFLLSVSMWRLRNVSFVRATGSLGGLMVIYIAYMLAIWRITVSTYSWSIGQFLKGGLYQLAIASIDFVIFNIGIYGLITAALGAAVSYWMTSPKLIPERKRNK